MAFRPEINAITFHIVDMPRSLAFYRALGFEQVYGGPTAAFSSLSIGSDFVNLQRVDDAPTPGWGRVIFHVESPDEVHQRCVESGFDPMMAPSNAPWGERYFHVRDPDGHELSFARKL